MKGQILRWNWLRDACFGVKLRVSLMCVGCKNPFRMTALASGEKDTLFYYVTLNGSSSQPT